MFISVFLIRLIALNQSLWLDEGTTARVVKEYGFTQIVSGFSRSDFHPPLYYFFMKAWTLVFGTSEIALRMPSVIFSILTGWIIYLIGGVWPAAFFLFNPLVIYYSQEARMYLMATFFLTGSIYYLLQLVIARRSRSNPVNILHLTRLPRSLRSLAMTVCILLSFLTFYGSIFLIAPMLLYLLYKKDYRSFLMSSFALGLSLIIISPLLYQQLLNSKKALGIVLNWKQVLGTVNIKNLLLIPIKFSFGRISFYPKKNYYLIAGLWSALVWLFAIKGGIKKRLLLFLAATPILIGLIFSFFTPLLQYFRFLYLLPIISILIAVGANKQWQRWTILIGFTALSLVYLINPGFHREDWKSLALKISPNKPVYMIPSSSDALRYYKNNIKIYNLLKINNLQENNIIIIPYTSEIYGFDYHQILKEKKYILTSIEYSRGLSFENWKKSQ